MSNDEVKFIEEEYKQFYDKFSYINENTFCVEINMSEENEEESKDMATQKMLKLVIQFDGHHFEVLNEQTHRGTGTKKTQFESIEQIFDTFCPQSFKKFVSQGITRRLNSSL
ncbi:conserved Plasmodium protein, unknown function [Plasmodium vivax]|uniref:(malaria parasite P. vivax) hypothetical protein n=1 Tax=Plasmodium vivax TaxID=5855 RepID=A0A1G4GUY2_PLAVI|nr:unnamed protein product [Plasmodium vivax]CAI7719508.1 conserved Plasmodium protein, unknown function [Plasmodium vivax]SCO66389.1 conserved Plasmodium protein, unknown function [Plasmodium vivax]SCO71823.1 conserved Plasmodium protein, unknown function [Plasmodium vivax]VUZ94680.1 conserved Plasmodium protein, unknown function [Plasmodium vivax]